jgi:adenylate cyclase class IV
MHSYEVEIKTLLGSKENADSLLSRMREVDPSMELRSRNSQLNHYFIGGNLARLAEAVADVVSPEAVVKLKDLAARAKDFSVRTRKKDDEVILVAKVSVGDDTSANGVSRMEFEEKVGLTLEALDQRLLDAGFEYQAKWSRDREEYVCAGATVCLDRNAGYGYLAEFEKVVDDAAAAEAARAQLTDLMEELGVSELPQDRLERMFAHYNQHWADYYGTDKIFIIE